MITISKAAKDKITSLKDEDNKFIRAGVRGGGCSGFTYFLKFDNNFSTSDKKIKINDITLLVDAKSYLYLMGTEIDYVDGLSGKGFRFVNPNAKRTCGCGESFSV
tara:strand:+ start:17352 stop:17666 length:315 start_codon:yes stop_codon:yes gene_type:complete